MYERIEDYFKHLLKLPEHAKKDEWVKVFNAMSVHTRKRLPKESLLARRPNEDEKIFNYRLANYRAITYGSMNKAMDDLHRIVSGISYTLNVPDNVREYLNTHVLSQYSAELHSEIINTRVFIEKITLKRDIEDPNGFLIWFPTGEGLTDSSKKVTPEPKLVLSDSFIYCDQNVFIYKSDEKSPLKDEDGKTVMEGEVYYFLTKNDIWKMYQTGKKSEPKWKQDLIYKHNLGAFPVIVLGGDMNSEGYYESYFAPYLAFGDEAIVQYSDWQAQMTLNSFPIKEIFANECRIQKVHKQSNNPSDSEENYSGGGNGEFELVPIQASPFGVVLRKIGPENLNDDTLKAEIESVRFISPPIENAKYAGESWIMLVEKAEKALNIDMTVGLDQSGVAKQIDKEAQYAMISKIGSNFFDNIYRNSLKIIDGYLNRITFEKSQCSINKPSTFWIKTETDLVNEISQLKTNNAPGFFLQEATMDLARKRFNGNPVSEKIFKFIALYDPFYTFTSAEKSNMVSAGVMTKEDYVRSLRIFTILNQVVEEESAEKFMDLKMSAIKEKFDTLVAEFIPEEETVETDDNGNIV